MPTTDVDFPAAESDRHAAHAERDARDPQARIARALERTRAELEVVLGEVHNARSVGLRLELVDRALRLHFLGSRLSRRLSMLGEGGLLALSAIRETDISSVVLDCAAEVAPECRRRQIVLEVQIAPAIGASWLDAEQLCETVRCLIDDAIEALPQQGTLVIEARNDIHGVAISVRDDRPQSLATNFASDLFVAARFADALAGELERRAVGSPANTITETTLRIPEMRATELCEAHVPRSNAA